MIDVKLTTATKAQKLATLADLVYQVSSSAEFLDSDKVEAMTDKDQIATLFHDLDYLKRHLEAALGLARELMND
jgi:hypothetical protein